MFNATHSTYMKSLFPDKITQARLIHESGSICEVIYMSTYSIHAYAHQHHMKLADVPPGYAVWLLICPMFFSLFRFKELTQY